MRPTIRGWLASSTTLGWCVLLVLALATLYKVVLPRQTAVAPWASGRRPGDGDLPGHQRGLRFYISGSPRPVHLRRARDTDRVPAVLVLHRDGDRLGAEFNSAIEELAGEYDPQTTPQVAQVGDGAGSKNVSRPRRRPRAPCGTAPPSRCADHVSLTATRTGKATRRRKDARAATIRRAGGTRPHRGVPRAPPRTTRPPTVRGGTVDRADLRSGSVLTAGRQTFEDALAFRADGRARLR